MTSGTATPGTDYLGASGSLTFAPGVTAQQLAIPLVADLANEPDETFLMTLSNGVDVLLPVAPTTATR